MGDVGGGASQLAQDSLMGTPWIIFCCSPSRPIPWALGWPNQVVHSVVRASSVELFSARKSPIQVLTLHAHPYVTDTSDRLCASSRAWGQAVGCCPVTSIASPSKLLLAPHRWEQVQQSQLCLPGEQLLSTTPWGHQKSDHKATPASSVCALWKLTHSEPDSRISCSSKRLHRNHPSCNTHHRCSLAEGLWGKHGK